MSGVPVAGRRRAATPAACWAGSGSDQALKVTTSSADGEGIHSALDGPAVALTQ